MTELTEQQRQAVGEGDHPVRMVDPVTRREYVLVPAELFEQLAGAASGDLNPRDAYPAIDRALAELWNDPIMDAYDRDEEHRR